MQLEKGIEKEREGEKWASNVLFYRFDQEG